jgi:hypothetical protein
MQQVVEDAMAKSEEQYSPAPRQPREPSAGFWQAFDKWHGECEADLVGMVRNLPAQLKDARRKVFYTPSSKRDPSFLQRITTSLWHGSGLGRGALFWDRNLHYWDL